MSRLNMDFNEEEDDYINALKKEYGFRQTTELMRFLIKKEARGIMIRKLNGNFKGVGDFGIYCDSCHVKIARCINFNFEDGQELMYSPILCEKCGTERSKDHGDKIKRIAELEKELAN